MANLSKIKRDQLLNEINNIENKYRDDTDTLNTLNKLKQEITNKKYGLVWEEHSEKVDEMLVDNIPVFTEDKSREIVSDPNLPYNFIIEGDNLHALKLLEKTHKGKIDVIYIDPPYNTLKSGFTYNDKMVDVSDRYRHSKWLSFFEERLVLSKLLLSNKGVIFISIDNSELYNLKLLCDNIFDETNFIGNIVWRTTTDNNITQITTEHEYILCYALNKNNLNKWISKSPIVDMIQQKYEELRLEYKQDNKKIEKLLRKWIKENKEVLKGFTHYDNIDDKGVFHDGDIANTVFGGYKYDIYHPVTNKICKIPDKGYRFSEETMKEMLNNDDIMFGKDENTLIKPKIRLLNNKSTLKAYYYEDNRTATKTLETIFNEKSRFSNPKSTNLLKMLFSYSGDKESIILDFFAGSGSTADAVLQLNIEDQGNRKFILCTNNEISANNTIKYLHDKGYLLDYNPGERTDSITILNKIKSFFENKADLFEELFTSFSGELEHATYGICRFITYPRIKTVITGKRIDGTQYSNGISANLKYYKTDFIPKNTNQDQTQTNQSMNPTSGINEATLCDKLQDHIRELVQLETHHNIDDDYYKMVLTDADLSNLFSNISTYPNLNEIYISSTILLDSKQKQILQSKNIKISEIPDYYFSNELKENGELW